MAFPSPEGSLANSCKPRLVLNDQMVTFTCDRGEGGSGAVPQQLCSQTPTQGDTKSFSAAGQQTQCFSFLPAWDHALRAEPGQSCFP